MWSFKSRRRVPALGIVLAAVLAAIVLATACKPKNRGVMTEGSAAASASAAPAGTLTGPCGDYVNQVCGKIGSKNGACEDLKKAAELLSPATCTAAQRDMNYTLGKVKEQRKLCDQLATKLCGEIGKDTETCQLVETQTKQFQPERCKMMFDHYKEVVAELKKMEEKNKPLSAEVQSKIAASDAPAFGPPNAKVTVVEFSDFQCPFCSRAASVVTQIREKFGSQVRFVFRQFPLGFHKHAQLAAQAALAANAQGKFWEYHDLLFKNQTALDEPALEKYATQLGLDPTKFKGALNDKETAAKVEADKALGNLAGVQGTPTMFVNGKRIQNPTNFGDVSKAIESALKS